MPFFDYSALYASRHEQYRDVVMDVMERGAFILQDELRAFEDALARYCGAGFAVGVGNCTDALTIGLAALGIGPGDEIIAPSHTFVATISTIVRVGAHPVLVEVGTDHLIDPAAVEAAITPRTAAIMPVSLNGRCAELPELRRIADAHGLAMIEDSAQALGATIDGMMAGTFGDVGTFSFYPAKNLGCFGDGGALITNSDLHARFARLYRDHGRNHDNGEVELWGINSRLDNLQAAVLGVGLEHYRATISRRREIAASYHAAFAMIDGLRLPPGPNDDARRFDTFQNYEIEVEDRAALQGHLRENGVSTVVQWGGKAVHQFDALGLDVSLPFTEHLFEHMLLLPMNHLLTDMQVDRVVDEVRKFFRS